MLSIGVIVPSWRYWIDPLKLQPLWEMYYATLLDERLADVTVEITDMRHPEMSEDYSKIPEKDVYLYWVMKTADAPEVYGIVKYLKERYPQGVHIAGGTHVDNCPDESEAIFDAAVHGTAEELLVSAINDYKNKALKGVYKSDMPFPFENYSYARRDFIPPSDIANASHFAQYGGTLATGVYFSRGCSFKCNFCVYNWPPKFELRTPQQIKDELEYLKREYHIGAVNLKDEVSIPVDRKAAEKYLEAIGSAGIIWRGQTVPIASEDLVVLAKESGCVELAIGLESVESDEVLKIANVQKHPGVERSRRFIHLLKKHGINVKLCLIFGLPGESKDVVKNTIRFLEDTEPDFVSLSGFDPVPGSTFYKNRDYYGIEHIDDDLTKHAHLLYRFGDEEEVGLPFNYSKTTKWGESLTRQEIVSNMREMQHYLAEKGLSY
jgi:radical SAM superfamily enzyme YgiQ (UPF0313 family)